jgi:hypothetical protein
MVQEFGDRKQIVDRELQGARDVRKIRLAIIGRCGDGLDQSGHHIGRVVIFA